ncbi:hypothetical protein FO519_009933 [Halicephalobus sp. NKZ332]|nr:hypothetical protein FO519_009933 [Halicephalobus sp. NKZ332]
MHLNEIRMLKEEIKTLRTNNHQLQDMCCFLDEDRQKTRQLSKEWQKFGRYTSELMKQEITTYQQRLQEQDQRHQQLLAENEELKRLCLYLDEQRQQIIAQATAMAEEAAGAHMYYSNIQNDVDSSDAGCGSSEKSEDSEKEFQVHHQKTNSGSCQSTENQVEFDQEREKALKILTEQMQTSYHESDINMNLSEAPSVLAAHNDRLFNYIHSLENRIKNLEHQGQSNCNRFSRSSFGSDDLSQIKEEEEPDLKIEKDTLPRPLQILSNITVDNQNLSISRQAFCRNMVESTTSTMTSSGTTYCSSETDESAATAVFIMGDEEPNVSHLEVRTLGPIDEEQENESSESGTETLKIKKSPSLNIKGLSPLKYIEKRISSSSENSTSNSSNCNSSNGDTEESGIEAEELPPKMPLIGDPTTRLSHCSSNLSLDNCSNSSSSKVSGNTNRSLPEEFNSLGRPKVPPSYSQVQLRHRPSFNCPPFASGIRPKQMHSSLAEAVKSFKSGEDTAVLRKLCQNAWESLNNGTSESQITAQITAV